MFNNQTPGYNSMINYFQAASYGKLNTPSHFFPEPDGSLILSYQDEHPRSYYQPYHPVNNPNGYEGGDNGWDRTAREHKLLRNAIEHISNMVPSDLIIDYDNDGRVDNVCFIVKGDNDGWANLLWPHRWVLYNEYATIHGKRVWDYNFQLEGGYFNNAVLCHEMQHTLSYPDFYHYANGGPSPVGNWDIMESNPNPPQQSGTYAKWKYGNWLTEPVEITDGIFTLNSVGNGTGLTSYKIPSIQDPQQFFVLEFRNSSDLFENFNYGNVAGLLVYRINTRWNGNAGYNPNGGVYDEVFIFRPNGNNPNQSGDISQAHFGPGGRTTFNATSNPKPFLTDGTYITDLSITNITVTGNKVSFTYNDGTAHFFGVTFNANGGRGVMSPQLFEEEVEQNIKINSFTLEDYIFAGWAFSPDGEVVYTDNQPIVISEELVLYAVWKTPPPPPVYYTINASVEELIPLIKDKSMTIEPEGEVLVLENTNQTFIIKSEGYKIMHIEVDGVYYHPQTEEEDYYMAYTFENVTENHYITAYFYAPNEVDDNKKTDIFFSIQPNPATQYFEIVLPSSTVTSKGVVAQIFDVQGLLLKTEILYNEKTHIDISNLAKGFYIIKIDKEAKKLIVK